MSKLRAYCELVRLPNLFTAAADILAGYWFVARPIHLSASLLLLITASCSLYAAGIVFNDVRDSDIDARERPARPIPSGRISRRAATQFGVALSIVGLIAAALARSTMEIGGIFTVSNRTAILSVILLVTILLYDFVLKDTPLGPVSMGACRALNLAMPISLASFSEVTTFRHVLAIIGAFGLYVASLTWFGRGEAGDVSRRRLVGGTFGILLALLSIGVLATSASEFDCTTMVLWLALLIHLLRVCLRTIRRPSPEMVQYAMKTLIFGIVAFDAVIASASAGWPAAVAILALLIPMIVLGRRIYST